MSFYFFGLSIHIAQHLNTTHAATHSSYNYAGSRVGPAPPNSFRPQRYELLFNPPNNEAVNV